MKPRLREIESRMHSQGWESLTLEEQLEISRYYKKTGHVQKRQDEILRQVMQAGKTPQEAHPTATKLGNLFGTAIGGLIIYVLPAVLVYLLITWILGS